MIITSPDIRSIVDQDGGVLLDMQNNVMVVLDATGAYVWQQLERGLGVESIIAELAYNTGADAITIAKDVSSFVEQLGTRQLVKTTCGNSAISEESPHG
jgi:Coenzyme PQQ synthesis protein D (PqqD)